MSAFAGFPRRTVEFLSKVRDNNTKAWFDEHRSDYEAYWLAPAREFVDAMGEALVDIAPDVVAEPKVNGSIRRINRDTRFSKDKTPYKDHLDVGFWEGERKNMLSGFWLRIAPDTVGYGVGVHGFDKQRLSRYRDAVVDQSKSDELASSVAVVEATGHAVHGEHYKRVPSGYHPTNEFQDRFIRFAALYTAEDVAQPSQLHTGEFVDWLMTRWEQQLPLHRWLVDSLG